MKHPFNLPSQFMRSATGRFTAKFTLFAVLLGAVSAPAATIVWNGASGAGTNWSTAANWFGGSTPVDNDDLKFFEAGTNLVAGTPNSALDAGFTANIGSLQFGQSNGFHTVFIASGQTLNVTNTGGLFVGTLGDVGAARVLTNSIKGVGAALNLNNTSANLVLNQGQSAANGSRAILDLSGLDTFTANIKAIGIGSVHFQNAVAQRNSGILFLARTNTITLSLTNTLANYQTLAAVTNAVELVHAGSGNNASVLSFIYLGQTNAFFVDSMGFGRSKSSAGSAATMIFNPAFASPVAYFRGVNGPNSRVTWWAIGDMADAASSAQVAVGTNNFSGGTVDALVETMSLARDCSANHTSTANDVGVLTFTGGTIDVNNLIVGNQSIGTATSFEGNVGIVNVNAAAAKLVVNNTLELGHTSVAFVAGVSGTNAIKTTGTLNIRDGLVLANRIIVGNTSTNNVITMTNGTLVVSNTVGTLAGGVTRFTLTNSTLQLNITGVTNIVCTNLVSGGLTNIINPATVAVFAAYPKQVTLIKYVSQLGLGVTNFGFGANVLPASAPGAYLSNNLAGSSLDLVLPNDPRPVITAQPTSYSGNPGDNVNSSFAVTINPNSVTPLYYYWYYYTNGATSTNLLANGPGPSGVSTIASSTTANLTLANAQPGDNGNYFVVVSNAYGTASSTLAVLNISAGCVAPVITGPNSQTVIQGNNATFSASVSANPAAYLQWQTNGIDVPGANGSSVTLNNVQYPADDQTIVSIIATNACGNVTNSATLTVIVPPAITTQPVSVTVLNGAPASFTVAATGVPTPGYVWKKNNAPVANGGTISGANLPTLSISAVTPSDISTNYYVTVTNAAGTANSVSVSLIVTSAMSVVTLSPANGAAGICYDTPLAITFSQAPLLRAAGTIRIYNVNSGTPVDTINLSAGSPQSRSVGGESFNTYPVLINGNTANIYPHAGVMTSNQTYYVLVDNGVFTDSVGAYFAGITATNVWKISTKPGGPANPTNLVIVADNTGDFDTLQGALDSLPANNLTFTKISVANGTFKELVNINHKNNLLIRGASRAGTIIGYPNNDATTPGTHFRMAFKINANDIALDNLTVTNMTPQGGTQAEAIMMETSAARIIVNNANVASFQDTILANTATTKAYFNNSLIQGDVDFIWGGGNLFFTNCEVRYLLRSGNAGAVGPNPSPGASEVTSNGFSFINCLYTAPANATNDTIGRTRGIAAANMALIHCLMSPVLAGWGSDALPTSNFRNWFSGCSNLTATATVALTNGIALPSSDANIVCASSSTCWLYGWVPQLAPNILTQPANQSVAGGQTAMFSVVATGISDPTYQWLKDGTNLVGQTSATLTINNASANDVGAYSVIVSNAAGTVTSSTATLTVGNNAPTLAPVSDSTVNVGVTVNKTNVATDLDVPVQTLAFTLLSGPGSVGSGSGIFTWRPPVGSADTTNVIKVVVTDNGTPNLSATNTFTVIVNPLTQPNVDSPAYVGGQFSLTVNGQVGPDYALQVSTDLTSGVWITLLTTNSPPSPFIFVDPNAGAQPMQFYRIKVGPPLP